MINIVDRMQGKIDDIYRQLFITYREFETIEVPRFSPGAKRKNETYEQWRIRILEKRIADLNIVIECLSGKIDRFETRFKREIEKGEDVFYGK